MLYSTQPAPSPGLKLCQQGVAVVPRLTHIVQQHVCISTVAGHSSRPEPDAAVLQLLQQLRHLNLQAQGPNTVGHRLSACQVASAGSGSTMPAASACWPQGLAASQGAGAAELGSNCIQWRGMADTVGVQAALTITGQASLR